ncbi:TPA: hypothetical protein KPJ62_003662 [Clostridioides difficile]|nr:hypothetical protein [Clostridioides difficile]
MRYRERKIECANKELKNSILLIIINILSLILLHNVIDNYNLINFEKEIMSLFELIYFLCMTILILKE